MPAGNNCASMTLRQSRRARRAAPALARCVAAPGCARRPGPAARRRAISPARARGPSPRAPCPRTPSALGDVALGVLKRLPAAVVGGYLAGVGVGDLDVEAVHVVVGDAQVGNASAAALALIEHR